MKIKKRIRVIEETIEALRQRVWNLNKEFNIRCPPKTVKFLRFTAIPLKEGEVPEGSRVDMCYGFACKKCRRISKYTEQEDLDHKGLCEICYRMKMENPDPEDQPIPPLPKGV